MTITNIAVFAFDLHPMMSRRVNDTSRGLLFRQLWLTILVLFLGSFPIAAQELPTVTPPTPDFYGAAGRGVKVAWSLDRKELRENEELTATLTVSNVTNPRRVVRPDLKHEKLREFQDLFVITDVVDPPPAENATEVRFTYRLRPRSIRTDRVPTLVFQYYNAAAAAGKQFPVTNTGKPIPIAVTAAPAGVRPPAVPLAEPDHLFMIAAGPDVLANPWAIPDGAKIVVVLAGPMFALGWYAAWRRIYPDSARLAKIRRSGAVRRVLGAVQRSRCAEEPVVAIAAAMLEYFRASFPLLPVAVTPAEIGESLHSQGVPPAECEAVTNFFRRCDAARYSPVPHDENSLAADAASLIVRLEAAG